MKDIDYVKACGVSTDITLFWILDEFDDSFDTLAMGSLRYHLYHSHCDNSGPYGDKMLALLEDFEELHKRDSVSWKLGEHMQVHGEDWLDQINADCETCDEYMDIIDVEDNDWRNRQMELRHRFVDLTPGLWS